MNLLARAATVTRTSSLNESVRATDAKGSSAHAVQRSIHSANLPRHVADAVRRAARDRPLRQHAAVEMFGGTMVSHSFIAYRDDRAEASQSPTRVCPDDCSATVR